MESTLDVVAVVLQVLGVLFLVSLALVIGLMVKVSRVMKDTRDENMPSPHIHSPEDFADLTKPFK